MKTCEERMKTYRKAVKNLSKNRGTCRKMALRCMMNGMGDHDDSMKSL